MDVSFASLLRQTHQDIAWIVVDALYEERKEEFWWHTSRAPFAITYCPEPPKPEDYYSNLPAIYNYMIGVAQEYGADLCISLQDYIWLPIDGVKKFTESAQTYPEALLTGLCSMAREPTSASVADPKGLWSVFAEDYQGPPKEIDWRDVRNDFKDGPTHTINWEMNWAAFPTDVGTIFDESYGQHIGHENQQFAEDSGRPIILDKSNHAISLPHRYYFEWEWAEQQEHRRVNMSKHLARAR